MKIPPPSVPVIWYPDFCAIEYYASKNHVMKYSVEMHYGCEILFDHWELWLKNLTQEKML
jgi:hypothetical protein